jgi:hypothetical protein
MSHTDRNGVLEPAGGNRLGGTSLVPEPPKLGLTLVPLGAVAEPEEVTILPVRELKGLGQVFTPDLGNALQICGLVHKSPGGFDTCYQLLCGPAANDPRIAQLARWIAFVPSFAWDSLEVVLRPVPLTVYGQYLIRGFTKLQGLFPTFKVSVQWHATKRRHSIYHNPLSPDEAKLIGGVKWPDAEAIREALEPAAFDSVEALAGANEAVRTLLTAREVD